MIADRDFKTKQWKKEALKVHTLVSLHISKHLDQEWERLSFKKALFKKALMLIDELDQLLEITPHSFKQYQYLHQALFGVLKDLQLEPLIINAIREKFGAECFFIKEFYRSH